MQSRILIDGHARINLGEENNYLNENIASYTFPSHFKRQS